MRTMRTQSANVRSKTPHNTPRQRASLLVVAALLALAVTLAACGRDEGPLLRVTYAGGFSLVERQVTVFTVNEDANATLQYLGADNETTSITSRQLSEAEFDQLREILSNISTLNESYGQELRGMIADAGYADIALGGERTRVDPNIDEAYPPELQPLREWIGRVLGSFDGNPAPVGPDTPDGGNGGRLAFTECDPANRPQACTREYLPVCGQAGGEERTYGNGCTACADPNVTGYWPGACGQMPSDTPTPREPTGDGGENLGRYMVCDRNAADKPADYAAVAQQTGYECVDECPRGYDGYGTQIGALVCIKHIGQQEALRLPSCETAENCAQGDVCIYVISGTDGTPLQWSGERGDFGLPADALRCAPQEYQNYRIHTGGATVVDENGDVTSMIA